ncbi:cyclase family protein [Rhizobium rhizogenes]|uniref:cyclase family protein n=1 Tax=Rhizobium rhizogenes TaxID=359 RepID=UPI00157469A7|nr:cyclase family protein [Rhizobium rhizogenes]NTI78510.1 cyclase family protein [Rhizobium rhizogenes]
MARKLIDISVVMKNGIRSDPPGLTPEIAYRDHDFGAREFETMAGVPISRQIEGKGCASEECRITTHAGTHLDAPWHYHPTMNNGERAWTIEEVPLEWCYGRGVKLDFRDKPDGYVCQAADIEAELERIGHTLEPLDIILVNTAAGTRYGEDDFLMRGCGMGREATLYLTSRGVRVVGTDGWSWDAPFGYTRKRIEETGDYSLFWEGHKAGMEQAYCQIEKLSNLESLPPAGFDVVCFPVKVERGSAGWCRAVAVLDD